MTLFDQLFRLHVGYAIPLSSMLRLAKACGHRVALLDIVNTLLEAGTASTPETRHAAMSAWYEHYGDRATSAELRAFGQWESCHRERK